MPPVDEIRDRHRGSKHHRSAGKDGNSDSRSHSRDSRAQEALRRSTDAQPDGLRRDSRPPTASARNLAASQSAQPQQMPPAKPAAGVLGAGHRNAFALEAAQLLKQRGAVSTAPTAAEAPEDPEDGELPAAPPVAQEQASRKRKHSPIVWQEGGKQPASAAAVAAKNTSGSPHLASAQPSASPSPETAATAVDAAGRAAAELAQFQDRQAGSGDDIDPDAPAAMKDSPSVSGDDAAVAASGGPVTEVTSAALSVSLGHGMTVAAAVMTTGGNADSALADMLDRVVPAPTSRWATMIEEAPARGAAGEEAALDALNARERKELADGQGLQTPEHEGGSLDGAEGSPGSDVTTGPSMLQQCREVQCFERLNDINEGTYGMVYRAREKQSGKIHALKKIKMERETEGFPLTSIREINILLALHHKNIVNVTEVVVGKKLDDVFMVMEFMEHDLKGLMEERDSSNPLFAMSEIKTLVRQLIEGVSYLHDNWVIHRDLKTSNILYNNKGDLKICDFGLARQYGSPLRPYTHMVVTLWYRAPELLLGVKEYSTAIDMWSVGCIMGELILNAPLLSGKSEMEQIHKIFSLVGSPTDQNWPKHRDLPNLQRFKFPATAPNLESKFPVRRFDFDGRTLSEAGFELLSSLLTLDPEKRATAAEALEHRWFKEAPFPKDLPMMPTFPVKQGEGSHHHKRRHNQPSPRKQAKAASASAALLQPNSCSR